MSYNLLLECQQQGMNKGHSPRSQNTLGPFCQDTLSDIRGWVTTYVDEQQWDANNLSMP